MQPSWECRGRTLGSEAIGLQRGVASIKAGLGTLAQAVRKLPPALYLSAGFGGNLKGGLESPSLLSGENGAWALGALVVLAFLASSAVGVAAILILAFHWKGNR